MVGSPAGVGTAADGAGSFSSMTLCSQSISERFARLRQGSQIILERPGSGLLGGADSLPLVPFRAASVSEPCHRFRILFPRRGVLESRELTMGDPDGDRQDPRPPANPGGTEDAPTLACGLMRARVRGTQRRGDSHPAGGASPNENKVKAPEWMLDDCRSPGFLDQFRGSNRATIQTQMSPAAKNRANMMPRDGEPLL